MANVDRCVMCGEIITEGYGQTCYKCRSKLFPTKTNLYDTICGKLTDFEHCNDKETVDTDWLQEFYHLLVRIQNAFECGEITI